MLKLTKSCVHIIMVSFKKTLHLFTLAMCLGNVFPLKNNCLLFQSLLNVMVNIFITLR